MIWGRKLLKIRNIRIYCNYEREKESSLQRKLFVIIQLLKRRQSHPTVSGRDFSNWEYKKDKNVNRIFNELPTTGGRYKVQEKIRMETKLKSL